MKSADGTAGRDPVGEVAEFKVSCAGRVESRADEGKDGRGDGGTPTVDAQSAAQAKKGHLKPEKRPSLVIRARLQGHDWWKWGLTPGRRKCLAVAHHVSRPAWSWKRRRLQGY
nr:hypothetical protein CFP56_03263 [Quercus suber]